MSQNIIELGFNVAEFTTQQKVIYDGLFQTLDAASKLDGMKIGLGSSGGWTELNKQVDALTKKVGDLEKQNIELAESYKKVVAAQKEGTTASNNKAKALAAEKKAAADAANDYKQLSLAYNEASLRAKNFQIALGSNHPIAIAATKDAAALGTQLKTLDASTGTFNRNVGNYGGALAEYGKKAFGFVRTAANILPGLGLSGAFLLIYEGLSGLISLFGKGTKAIDKMKESQETLSKAFDDNSYKSAVKNVRELTEYIELAKQGFLDKKDVLTEYNKVLGDTIGKAGSLDEAEQLLVKNGEAYIQMTLYKAAADLTRNEAAQKLIDKQKANLKFERSITSAQENKDFGNKEQQDLYIKNVKQVKEKEQKAADQYISDLEDIGKYFQKKAAEISKKYKFDLFGNHDKPGQKPAKGTNSKDDLFKSEEEKRKTLFEIQKRIIQDGIDTAAAILANDQKTFTEKLKASKDFYDLSIALIDKQKDFEIAQFDEKQKEEERKANKDISNKKERLKVLASIQEEYDAKRKLVATNVNSSIRKLDIESEKQITEFTKKETEFREKEKERLAKEAQAHRQSIHIVEMQSLKNTYDAELSVLEDKYSKGKISEKKYSEEKLRIQSESQVKLLQADIEFTKETLKLSYIRAQASGNQEDLDKVAEGFKNLEALKIKLATLTAELFKKKSEETRKSFIETFQQIAEVAKGVFELIGSFVDDNVTRQKNALQELIDANNAYASAEIERINNSTLSEQDKAAKIIQIKAEIDAKETLYKKNQRQLDVEKAKFDRAAGIALIILNTAMAVTKALPNIFEATIVGFLGAIQLERAIHAPVPLYAEGTENHPGGPAIAGEGKHKELVQEPGGKSYVVDKPTLIKNLAKGAKVIPLTTDMVNEAMHRSMITGMANTLALAEASQGKNNTADARKIAEWQADKIVEAIEKNKVKQVTKVNVINDFGWIDYLNKNVYGR